jgi:hypothetical protein
MLTASSQGELEHRRVKRFYQRVHKGKFTRGIAKQQQRERVIAKMKELAPQASRKGTQKRRDDAQGWGDSISSPDDETYGIYIHNSTTTYLRTFDIKFNFLHGSTTNKMTLRSR